jgi:hypothetical protein
MAIKKPSTVTKTPIIAYKVFNRDWTCLNYNFKNSKGIAVGTTHSIRKKPILCSTGFHYCKDLSDCFSYYEFKSTNKVAMVEILGDIDKTDDGDKECTNKIKILKELSWEEVLKMCNKGTENDGLLNNGYNNLGDRNYGCYNVGNKNFNNHNYGNYNTGSNNIGHDNPGHDNEGTQNNGRFNFGNSNSGSYNKTSYSNGFFNTTEVAFYMFNKLTKVPRDRIRFPYYLRNGNLTEFITEEEMTAKEKLANPSYKYTKGYLKKYTIKQVIKKQWKESDDADRRLTLKLPNFNNEIFKEITGIDVYKELKIKPKKA